MYYYMDMPFNSIDDVPDFGSIKMFYVGEPNLGFVGTTQSVKVRGYLLLSSDINKLDLINNAADGSQAIIVDIGKTYIKCDNTWHELNNNNNDNNNKLNILLGNIGIDNFDFNVINPEINYIQGLAIDHLVFDGTQYINLKYKPKNTTKIEIKFNQKSYQKFLFGCRTSNSSSDAFGFCAYENKTYSQFGSFQSEINNIIALNTILTLSLSQDGLFINNEKFKDYSKMNFSSNLQLYLGTRNQNNTIDNRLFIGDIFYVKIYEYNSSIKKYQLSKAFFPFYNGIKYGMYEILGNTFYGVQVSNTPSDGFD